MTRQGSATSFSAFSSLRRLVMLLALVTFAFQTYLVQVHIHGQPGFLAGASQTSAPAQPAPFDPYAPANCPLCQELLHAGVAIVPVAIPVLLPLTWMAIAEAPARLPAMATVPRTGWQSRAPPG